MFYKRRLSLERMLRRYSDGGATQPTNTGGEGDPPPGAEDDPGNDDPPPDNDGEPETLTMTQQELDAKIEEAVKKAARDAKRAARQAAKPKPTDKAPPDDPSAASAANDETMAKARRMCENAALQAAAARLHLADPADAVALADRSLLDVDDDGNVEGADDAVEALVKAKPHLVKPEGPPRGGAANGGGKPPAKENPGAKFAKRQLEQQKKAREALNDL